MNIEEQEVNNISQEKEKPEEAKKEGNDLETPSSQNGEIQTNELEGTPPETQKSEEVQETVESVEELKERLNRLTEDLQRERAEFINYRKRASQERIELESSIVARILDSALPVLDSFDQLLSSNEKSEELNQTLKNFLQGTELIQKQLIEVFKNYGVEEFNPVSGEFDPGCMEALHSEESSEVNTEMVSNVFQKGYFINGRLLRAARVAVLKPISSGEETKNEE